MKRALSLSMAAMMALSSMAFAEDVNATYEREATCTEPGIEYIYNDDGILVEHVIPALGHEAGEEAVIENEVPATCTEDGSHDEVFYCIRDEVEITRETIIDPALGHIEGDAIIENMTEAICEIGGSWDSVIYCTECGEEISREHFETAALEHIEAEPVIENNVDPTCLVDGSYDTVVYCSVCEKELSRETTVVEAPGHTKGKAKIENKIAPTCVSVGSQERVFYCTECGEEISRKTVELPIDPTAHNLDDWQTAQEPTCTEAGKSVRICLNEGCEYAEWQEIESLGGHIEGEPVIENEEAPTCTEEGSCEEVIYCTVCGEEISRETKVIPVAEHTPGEIAYVDVEPTCTEEGSQHFVCEVCEEMVYAPIQALGHKPGEIVIENEVGATCTAEGSHDEVVYCDICEEELSRETIVDDMLDHEWTEWEKTVTSTDGTKIIWKRICNICLLEETLVEGGNWIEEEITVAPTCTTDGERTFTTYEATPEGVIIVAVDVEVIPALGHTEGEAVIEDTEDGCYDSVVYCTVCDEEIFRETIAHTAGEAVIEDEVAPTCTATGSYSTVTYCAVCGVELDRVITVVEAIGHTPVVIPAVAPTATETGLTEGSVCGVCGEVLVAQEVIPCSELTAYAPSWSLSADGKSVFIKQPAVSGGSGSYSFAYNIYDANGVAVNYFYSDADYVAATCPTNGRYNVFVIVYDGVTSKTVETGWFDITGYQGATRLMVGAVSKTMSDDGKHLFIKQPEITGGSGSYTIAYNIYDVNGNAVNYFYSDAEYVAASTMKNGTFCVFVVVSDGTMSQTVNTGWFEVTGY